MGEIRGPDGVARTVEREERNPYRQFFELMKASDIAIERYGRENAFFVGSSGNVIHHNSREDVFDIAERANVTIRKMWPAYDEDSTDLALWVRISEQ